MRQNTKRLDFWDHPKVQILRRGLRARILVGLSSAFVSVMIYVYVIDLLDPRNNYDFFADIRRLLVTDEHQFFSGREGGFYIRIGESLEKRTAESGNLKIANRKSSGALDNARSVASQRKAFGLIQEDTLAPDVFIREHIRYITPLYLERMHILYDENRFQEILDARSVAPEDGGSIQQQEKPHVRTLRVAGNANDDDVKYFFQNAKISTGPTGSGSRLFAKYLLSSCEVANYVDLGLDFSDALTRMNSAEPELKVDAVFTIAGAPLDSVKDMLSKAGGRRFRLMSVDPSVVPIINKTFNKKLASATFKEKYANGDAVSTIGSWAFLISSRDVSDAVVHDTLSLLDDVKDDIRRDMRLETGSSFQLSEFNFSSAVNQTHAGWVRLLRDFLIFALTVAFLSALMMSFMAHAVSAVWKVLFYRGITRIYGMLPENTSLTTNNSNLPSPIIHRDQKPFIEELVTGQSELLKLAKMVRESYNYGELSIAHYSFLQESIQNLKAIFQTNFVQRLNEYFANFGEFDETSLRHFYTAGYLAEPGYNRLLARFGAEDSSGERPKTEETDLSSPMSRLRIFISYRREDSSFATDRIKKLLVQTFGKESVFHDADIPKGRDFRIVIDREIARCNVVLVVIGPNWLRRLDSQMNEQDYVRYEIEAAFEAYLEDKRDIQIIPVVLSPANLPLPTELPSSLRQICFNQGVTIRPDPEFNSSVSLLIRDLEQLPESTVVMQQNTQARIQRTRSSDSIDP